MKVMRLLAMWMLVGLFAIGVVGCENEGPMEEAGEELDETYEEGKEETAEAMEEMKEGMEETKEKMQE